MPLKTFSERFRYAMTMRGLTQRDVIQKTGIAQATISAYARAYRGGPRADNVAKIARVLDVGFDWLADGKGPFENGSLQNDPKTQRTSKDATRAVPQVPGRLVSTVEPRDFTRVPLISWGSARRWRSMSARERNAAALSAVVVAEQVVGQDAFAVRVTGDSMTSLTDPRSIQDGSTIIVDPDVEPTHQSIVLVGVDDTLKLRVLWIDGNERYLRALNPAYPQEPFGEAEICGVAVHQVLERSLCAR